MALRWIEGFETFSTTLTANIDAYLAYKYPSAASCTLVAGRTGGFGIRSSNIIAWPNFAPLSTWIMGCGYKKESNGQEGIMFFMDGGTNQIEVRAGNGGTIDIYRNGTYLGSGTATLLPNVWYYIETRVFIDSTTGSVEVRLNGVTDVNLTNVNTQASANNTVNTFKFQVYSQASYYDDMYICDTTGSNNNTFLGDSRVEGIMPTADGTTIQWTPLAGDNYANVNEIPPDGDTSYVSTNTTNDVDTYAFANLTAITSGVKGLQVNILNRKDDAGSREIAPMIRSGGTDYTGDTFSVLDNYATAVQVYEEDPNTAALWTVGGVNAAEFGQKMIS